MCLSVHDIAKLSYLSVYSLSGSNHHICQDNACGQPCEGCQECAGKSVAGFGDFCTHKVDAHGIKNSFGTGHGDGRDQPGERVRTGFFVYVQQKPGGSGGGKHFYNGEGNELAGKSYISRKMSNNG